MKIKQIIFLIILVVGSIYVLTRNAPYQNNRGKIFGTYYQITYQSNEDLHESIKAAMMRVDNSLSTFNKKSTITAINSNREITPDSTFLRVFCLAERISKQTGGAFDITVAPLVNAWGFGFKNGIPTDSATIDSLRQFVGYQKVCFNNGKIEKEHPGIKIDCSAIAKGFGCDEVARVLEAKGITNFMVEIGGEIVAKGKNDKGKDWAIGINKPIDDPTGMQNEIQEIVHINGKAMATSGNYRNFRYVDGKKVSHTIDPKTGYPVNHNLLSATVTADDCATADALATAFMVMGLEPALSHCEEHGTEAFFIYSDSTGNLKTQATPGFPINPNR